MKLINITTLALFLLFLLFLPLTTIAGTTVITNKFVVSNANFEVVNGNMLGNASGVTNLSIVVGAQDISSTTNWTSGSNVWLFTSSAINKPAFFTNFNASGCAGGTGIIDIVYWGATNNYCIGGTVSVPSMEITPMGTNLFITSNIPVDCYFGLRMTNIIGTLNGWRVGLKGTW